MRERLGEAKAIVPSAKKVGAFGSRLDVPIGHINAAYVRSHFDAMEVGISDGPRPDEILFCLVMTCGPRVHDRMGGLAAARHQGVGRAAMSPATPELALVTEDEPAGYRVDQQIGFVLRKANQRHVAIFARGSPTSRRRNSPRFRS